jgi:hypothetical protein
MPVRMIEMNVRTTTFFGIGAQKAGTTWLNDVLDTYPDCAVPPVKEIHFFDMKYLSSSRNELKKTSPYKERLAQMARMANGFERDVKAFWQRNVTEPGGVVSSREVFQRDYLVNVSVDARLDNIAQLARYFRVRDIETYADYLEEIRRIKGATTVGEFTPAYSMLPAKAFAEMDQRFPDCRFIFILRDPVSRFLSQLRFKRKQQVRRGLDTIDPVAYFDAALSSQEFLKRSDYRHTMETIESVIPKSRILYLFFEELVAPGSVESMMRQVEEFLSLRPKLAAELNGQVDERRNFSETAAFTEEQRVRLRGTLEGVYRFVEGYFGRLPTSWEKAD